MEDKAYSLTDMPCLFIFQSDLIVVVIFAVYSLHIHQFSSRF